MNAVVALGLAYASGSVPAAYLAGRAMKGIDLRTVGSGNLGATNVYRTLGAKVALVVFVVDVLKGALPAALLPGAVLPASALGTDRALWWALGFGIAAIIGHAKPVFLLWKGGGKGVATAAGVFAALAPVQFGLALLAFIVVLWRTGYVSAGSLTAAVVLPVALVASLGPGSPVTIIAVVVGIFVFWTHRANMARLRQGTEHRFSRSKPTEAS